MPVTTDALPTGRRSRPRRGDGERLREEVLEAAKAAGRIGELIFKPEFPFGDPSTVFERLVDLVGPGLNASA